LRPGKRRGTIPGMEAAFETGRLVLRRFTAGDATTVALGYRLRRSAWGHGYATEGARALVRRAFTELGVGRVVATTMAVNVRSRRVLEKGRPPPPPHAPSGLAQPTAGKRARRRRIRAMPGRLAAMAIGTGKRHARASCGLTRHLLVTPIRLHRTGPRSAITVRKNSHGTWRDIRLLGPCE
jgi:hypothetical protein